MLKTTNNKKETTMKNMIKTLIAGIMVIFITTSAMAGQVERPNVYHHYKTVISQVPYNVEVCTQGHVGGASSADVIVGAVIGGAIGNQIGKGKGNDAATILGAILGADIANKNKPGHSGTVCSTQVRYNESTIEVYSHSTITFMIDGKGYSVDYIHSF
jgi:uncharacterized protein YcfJ